MEFVFILVEPMVPGNIGASARALHTMGFSKLRLVNPGEYLGTEALTMAHGSRQVLENAEVFGSFMEAVKGVDFLIGTTAKQRSAHHDFFSLSEIPGILSGKRGMIRTIGIVFGKEESGLTNEQLQACDLMTYIPMKTRYPSLNLSQAVMLYAYALSGLERGVGKHEEAVQAEIHSFRAMVAQVEDVLVRIGIEPGTPLFHRIRERISLAEETDLHLLLSAAKYVKKKFPDAS